MKPVYRKWVVIPGILLAAIALAALLGRMKPEQPERQDDRLDLLVEVLELKVSSEEFRIRSQGTIRPKTQTVLSAEVSGSIVRISPKFVAGGIFASGEELMRIDPTNYSVAVDRSEALVAQRQIEYDGAKKLRKQGYRAESEYASAAAALASAQAELVAAQRNLERTFIRLLYDGMVLDKNTDLGEFVNPGSQLGTVFGVGFAEVRLPLTDSDLAFLELPAAGTAGAGPAVKLSATQKGRHVEWDAQIVRTEGVVDERSRVTYAVAQIADPYRLQGSGDSLPIGTFVAAEISGATMMDVIRVPRLALRGADQVLVVNDENRIEIRTVDVIRADDTYAYLGGGVSAGERITTTAIEAPTNGMVVRTAESIAAEKGDDEEKFVLRAEDEK